MVERLRYAKHKVILRCDNCGTLMKVTPRDILEKREDWYDTDLVRVNGPCPGCGMFYGLPKLYADPDPYETLYFYAEILGDLDPEKKEILKDGKSS